MLPISLLTMLTDSLFWIGLGSALVLIILIGCRIVIDFPGLLDDNIVHIVKEVNNEVESFRHSKIIKDNERENDASYQDIHQLQHVFVNGTHHKQSKSVNHFLPLKSNQKSLLLQSSRQSSASAITNTHTLEPEIQSIDQDKDRTPHKTKAPSPSYSLGINYNTWTSRANSDFSMSCVSSSDSSTTARSVSASSKVYEDNVARIQVNNRGDINIVIKNQENTENISISIDLPRTELGTSSQEVHEDMVTNTSDHVHYKAEGVQCDLYQTKQEHLNRYC